MRPRVILALIASPAFLSTVSMGCKSTGESGANSSAPAPRSSTAANPTVKTNEDGTIPSGTGIEKAKPVAGKGNVQGKVFYNGKPVTGVEVKLSETFSRFLGNPGGETFTTKTDANGEYLIKDVTPRVYEGLLIRVFETPYYVFATSGIVQSAKYRVEADKTYFAPDTHLYKHDLKLLSPRAGSKIAGSNIELKWAAYPDAAYYRFSIHADSATGATTEFDYINKRVDALSYALEKPLSPGGYRCEVTAYNGDDIKLAESPDDVKFTVK